MKSTKTNALYSELTSSDKQESHNIYAILYADMNDTVPHVEIVNTTSHLSLSVIVRRFLNSKINEIIGQYPPGRQDSSSLRSSIEKMVEGRKTFKQDENGMWVEDIKKGGIRGAVQVLCAKGQIYPISWRYISDKSVYDKLTNAIIGWVSENLGIKATVADSAAPVPFMDYEVNVLCEQDFPGIYEMAKRIGISLDDIDLVNRPVVILDFSNYRISSMVREQLGEEEGGFVERQNPLRITNEVYIAPPFTVMDSSGKSISAIMRELLTLVVNDVGAGIGKVEKLVSSGKDRDEAITEVGMERFLNRCKVDMSCGSASGNEIMFQTMSSEMSGDGWIPDNQSVNAKVSKMKASGELSDEEAVAMSKFLNVFVSLRNGIFPPSVANGKRFYYSVSVPPGFQLRHKEIFDKVFKFESALSENSHLLISYFMFPAEVLRMFGYGGIQSVKEFDPSIRTLVTPVVFSEDGGQPDVMSDVEKQNEKDKIGKIEGKLNDVSDYSGMIISLTTVPYIYAECKKMFDARKVDFSNIPVILLRMENRGTLGGYISKRRVSDAEKQELAKSFAGFHPPFIMINLHAVGMNNMDKVNDVIIHEVSHYIDDLLVESGKANPSIMKVDKQPETSLEVAISNIKNYLASPTEELAHSMEVNTHLSKLDADYVRRHRSVFTKKMMKLFMDKFNYTIIRKVGDGVVELSAPISGDTMMGTRMVFHSGPHDDRGTAVRIIPVSGKVVRLDMPTDKFDKIVPGESYIANEDPDEQMAIAQEEGYFRIINRAIDAILANAPT